ncbi:restriction endonuclease subunit S [Aeromonas jandaei]|uniref:restriction endonuclease subunit S n=1 Tax=Aeromonas jandaei TaxID=650 RepID=UPI003BA21F40
MSEVVAAAQQGLAGKYKPYPEYKDSGDYWFGQLPAHWQLSKLKYVTSIYGRIGFRGYTVNDIVSEGEGALVLSPSNVIGDVLDLERKTYLSWDKYYESPEIMVASGDILIVKTGSTFGKSALVNSISEPSTINPQMALLKNSSLEPRFLSYLLCTKFIRAKIEVSNTGSGIPTMTQENINSFPVPLPDTDEVTRISDFLDYETARIDRLIAQQQRLIELLKEKRQTVISHAVTKGLNPNAPMKDSGVEWLGQVPEHWSVVKLSYVLSLKSGDGITSNEIEPEGTYPVYGGNGLRGYCEQFNCNGTYALIGRQGALCGNVNVADGKFFASEHAVVVYPRIQFDVRFLSEFLRFMDLGQYSVSAAQPGISVERINMLSIAVPPIEEQSLIGQRISQVELQIERLVVKAEAGVLLLKERRTALISAAVTGKIDLRGWIPPAEEAAA